MLPTIRRFVYKMGFRPKLGTILHSPSYINLKDFPLMGPIAADGFRRGYEEMIPLGIFNDCEMLTQPVTTKARMYERMIYCPVCGGKLVAFVIDIKECPCGHGRAFPSDDDMGLPIITFQVSEGD